MTMTHTSAWNGSAANRSAVEALERANGRVGCPGCGGRIMRLARRPRFGVSIACLIAHFDEGIIDRWTGTCPCGRELTIRND